MTTVNPLAGRLHPGQVLLRTLVMLGTAAAVLAIDPIGTVPEWARVAVALLALASVARPESMFGLGLILLIGGLWLSQDPAALDRPWVLLAVAGVVTAHTGLLLAAQGPASVAPDPRQLLIWGLRGTGLWAGAVLVWVGARWLQGTPAPTSLLVAVLGLLLVATLWTGLRLSRRS